MRTDRRSVRKVSNREQLRVAGPTDTTEVAPIQNRDLPRMTTLAFQRRPKEGGQTPARGTIGIAGAADAIDIPSVVNRDLFKMHSDALVRPAKRGEFPNQEAPNLSRAGLALADAFARMASARAALMIVENALGRAAEAIMRSEDLLKKDRGSDLSGEDLASKPPAAGQSRNRRRPF
jgi:hypothetical protein